MSATTVFGQVGSDRASTHSKRNAVIVFTVIALFALSFFVGRTTAPTQARPAQVATHEQLNPADRAIIAGDAAPVSNTGSITKLSPANRALIANDVAPVTSQLSQANTASCIAGRPC
jgi:hypothetical protein